MAIVHILYRSGVVLCLLLGLVAVTFAQAGSQASSITIGEVVDVSSGTVTVDAVVAPQPAFLVIQRAIAGVPGDIIGQAAVPAGLSENVTVPLTEAVEPGVQLFASLYNDAGQIGVFEFLGADTLIFDNNQAVTVSFIATGSGEEAPQEQTAGETPPAPGTAPITDTPVITSTSVPTTTTTVTDTAPVTGTTPITNPVPGTDQPSADQPGTDPAATFTDTTVITNTAPVTAPAMITDTQPVQPEQLTPQAQGQQPMDAGVMASIAVNDQMSGNGNVTIQQVTIPEQGFLVIQQELLGVPGPIIGQVSVPAGTTENVVVPLTVEVAPDSQLFASLYRDAGQPGVFEFPGADTPIVTNNQSVVESFIVSRAAQGQQEQQQAQQDQQQAQQEQPQAQQAQQDQQQAQEAQQSAQSPALMPATGASGTANLPFTLLVGGLSFALLVGGNGLVQRLRKKQ